MTVLVSRIQSLLPAGQEFMFLPEFYLCHLCHLAGVFVHSIATGAGEYADIWSSFYGNVNQQVCGSTSHCAACTETISIAAC